VDQKDKKVVEEAEIVESNSRVDELRQASRSLAKCIDKLQETISLETVVMSQLINVAISANRWGKSLKEVQFNLARAWAVVHSVEDNEYHN
jgi:hypothetical protein